MCSKRNVMVVNFTFVSPLEKGGEIEAEYQSFTSMYFNS